MDKTSICEHLRQSLFHDSILTQKKGEKEFVLCAAMQLSQDHNPRTMWNVSSNCQRLKPTLVEQLQYTVSGRVLSL